VLNGFAASRIAQCPLCPIATAKADSNGHVCFTPNSRHVQCTSPCLLWANSGHQNYSITSLARASSDGGTVRLSALAVLRLIANSYLVAA